MVGVFKLFLRLLLRSRGRRRRRLDDPASDLASDAAANSAPGDKRDAVKKSALSAADVHARLHDLPEARVVHVVDGDTLIVAKARTRMTIRLDSIDCPEDGQPWGDISTYGLIKLVGRRTVLLEEHGIDLHGRTLATLWVRHSAKAGWLNVNERMITLGHAWVMRMYYDHLPKDRQDKLNQLETWAKSKKVGLWSTNNPIPPWKWRQQANVSPDG